MIMTYEMEKKTTRLKRPCCVVVKVKIMSLVDLRGVGEGGWIWSSPLKLRHLTSKKLQT